MISGHLREVRWKNFRLLYKSLTNRAPSTAQQHYAIALPQTSTGSSTTGGLILQPCFFKVTADEKSYKNIERELAGTGYLRISLNHKGRVRGVFTVTTGQGESGKIFQSENLRRQTSSPPIKNFHKK